jgi:hypothetical protein
MRRRVIGTKGRTRSMIMLSILEQWLGGHSKEPKAGDMAITAFTYGYVTASASFT